MATIKEIQEQLAQVSDLQDPLFQALKQDERSGVQKLLLKRQKEIQAELDEDLRLEFMLRYEKELYSQGFQAITGIDEVGRGPWAGPLVVGAVILGGAEIEGLDDSKKLAKKRREALDEVIRKQAAAWALGWVSAGELDEVGMSQALRLATRRAVKQVQAQCKEKNLKFNEIIIDGTVNFLADTALERYVTVMAKADGLIPSVSAASIIAKVARDQFMAEQDTVYPGYGFASNAGYGVAKHRAAIERLGVTPLHRLSFAPLAKYANIAKTGGTSSSIEETETDSLSPTTEAVKRSRGADVSAERSRAISGGDASEECTLEEDGETSAFSIVITTLVFSSLAGDICDARVRRRMRS